MPLSGFIIDNFVRPVKFGLCHEAENPGKTLVKPGKGHYNKALGGQTVTVCGWARTIRDMKTFGFIELNDGSCFKNLQVVMDANVLDNYKEIAGQNVGAALIVTGTVVLPPEPKQPLEVKAASIAVEGPSAPAYPLQK